jgi:hypothetical protein
MSVSRHFADGWNLIANTGTEKDIQNANHPTLNTINNKSVLGGP